MSTDEITGFFEEERVAVVSSIGPRGWPHSMPLWYVVRDGRIFSWTFRKSQKVVNLNRDDRATVLVEAGDAYEELRGVQLETEVAFHDDLDFIVEFAGDLTRRYAPGGGPPDPGAVEAFERQAPKRIVLEFVPVKTVSWDHRKLGGTY